MRIFLFLLLPFFTYSQADLKLAVLKYSGGGDWYSNPTSLKNLSTFCNDNIGTNLNSDYEMVEVGSSALFNHPFVHMTGHGNVVFSAAEARNLREYLLAGGFLHIDDNYGMDPFIRPEMKKVFPELDFVQIPDDHQLFNNVYDFPKGLPKIHEHDQKPSMAYGLIYEGRMMCLYTSECDLGDGWEDASVHNDPEAIRLKALKMGANIIYFVFNQGAVI
ncbi:MAG: DUF4159 domain-containing protein [Schleiferiaceae bacterium]|jgi:hypothetical protein|nr:DUF4159 domain-containing protein [Schleiferiaceae bacterium]